jgi:ubiquinone/menaquinone biosynthesis C-methylase UbiE
MPLPRVEDEIPGAYQINALLRGRPLQRAWHRARLDLVASVLPPLGDGWSLDLAAGSGILTWRFAPARIVSIDMRADACRAIRTHTAGAPALVAELVQLPFRESTFSRVYFLETLEHLTVEQGRAVLREVRRVVRPGARCLITTPNYRSHWVVLEWLIDALRLTPPFADGQHVSRYDSRGLALMAESAGWRVVRLGSFNAVAPLAGMLAPSLGAWATGAEASWAGPTGALLYAVCEPAA